MSDPQLKIIVNAREKIVEAVELSFDQVVELASFASSGGIIYTITYKRGPSENAEGVMVRGDVVKIQEGMVFNVTPTSKS